MVRAAVSGSGSQSRRRRAGLTGFWRGCAMWLAGRRRCNAIGAGSDSPAVGVIKMEVEGVGRFGVCIIAAEQRDEPDSHPACFLFRTSPLAGYPWRYAFSH